MARSFCASVVAALFAASLSTTPAVAQALLGASKTTSKPKSSAAKASDRQASASKASSPTQRRSSSAKPAPSRKSRNKANTVRVASASPATGDGTAAMREVKPNAAGLSLKLLDDVAVQAALDRAGFSPGVIDGAVGPKSVMAIKAFQNSIGLPVNGRLDDATRAALAIDTVPITRTITLSAADKSLVGDNPTDWRAKAKLSFIGYDSLAAIAAARGHCSKRLLARLNPGLDIAALKAGDTLVVPNVGEGAAMPKGKQIEIDFGRKVLRVLDERGRLVALFHCSIAKEKSHRPRGQCRIECIQPDPKYLFKPESWPEVKGIKDRLVIPPGPRNPVGVCWIGLSIKGYGIHGTPEPELIGKTGSHGCFRLTNWDVQRLSEMVEVGTKVRFADTQAG